jgi:hypothetical protein
VRRLWLVVLAFVSILIQLGLLPALRPFGVVPNLMLVVVTLVGLEGTASSALTIAVAGGLAVDLASGANFGLWTGTLVLAALVAGLVHRAGIELGGPLVAIVMVMVGTSLMALIVLAGLVNVVNIWPVGSIAGRLAMELVLNLVGTVALRPLIQKMVRS